MTTTYHVTSEAGELLGTFPTVSPDWDAIRALVDANPGATVTSVATLDNPCPSHPAYEADNCPGCGTERPV